MVTVYNATKYGMNVVDQTTRKYTAKAVGRRWHLHVFYQILDMAVINAWVIYKQVTKSKRLKGRISFFSWRMNWGDDKSQKNTKRLQEDRHMVRKLGHRQERKRGSARITQTAKGTTQRLLRNLQEGCIWKMCQKRANVLLKVGFEQTIANIKHKEFIFQCISYGGSKWPLRLF